MGGDDKEAVGVAERTLGDLLYADSAQPRVLEEEWVCLVRAVAAGDQRSLQALYERTHRLVYTLCVRMTHSPEIAEELTVDVFHAVWLRASRYDPGNGTVLGWVMNLARSRAIDRLRLEHRKKRTNPYPHAQADPIDPVDPQAVLHFKEQQQRLRSALGGLTPDERAAIETAFFSELSYAEAAQRLNQPLGTIKTRIRSGLSKLRRALTGEP